MESAKNKFLEKFYSIKIQSYQKEFSENLNVYEIDIFKKDMVKLFFKDHLDREFFYLLNTNEMPVWEDNSTTIHDITKREFKLERNVMV